MNKLTAIITPPLPVLANLTHVKSVLPPEHLTQELESLKHRLAELEQTVGEPTELADLTDLLTQKENQNEET